MKILQIIGRKKSGKTTTTIDFIRAARELGLNVAAFKQTHHLSVTMDIPGTDSFRFAEAGAAQVGMQNAEGFFWHETRKPLPLAEEIKAFVSKDTDLVLVEGFKTANFPALLLMRPDDEQTDFLEYSFDFAGTIYSEWIQESGLIDLTTEEKRKDWLKTWLTN